MVLGSVDVFSLDAVAAFPVTQTCIGALVVFERHCKCFSIDELLPALFDAGCCFHEKSATLRVSNICCAGSFLKVGEDLVHECVRRLRKGRN